MAIPSDPVPAHGGSRLRRGEFLSNQSLTSASGRCTLQNSFKVTTLYDNATGAALWVAPIRPDYGSTSRFALGLDGDVVVWNRYRVALWSSGTARRGVETLEVRDSGELVLLNRLGDVVWTTGTRVGPGPWPGARAEPAARSAEPAQAHQAGQAGPVEASSGRAGPVEAQLEIWIDSLTAGRGYTAAVVLDVPPAEALRRSGLPDHAITRSTWRRRRDAAGPGAGVVGAVALGPHTLLLTDIPLLPGGPLSVGTTAVVSTRTPGGDNDPGTSEWSLHRDGDTVAHLRDAPPQRRKGVKLPEVARALAEMGSYNAEWTAEFEGLELICRVAGVAPTAADLGGELLGGLLAQPEPSTTPSAASAGPAARTGARPAIEVPGDINDLPIVVVRTDYSSDPAWAELLSQLGRPDYGVEVDVHPVSDPAWGGAGIDEVLAALPPASPVAIFVADARALSTQGHPVLAVSTSIPAPSEDYEPEDGVTREFRAEAGAVVNMHVNFEIGNMGFEEFSSLANSDPDQLFRDDN